MQPADVTARKISYSVLALSVILPFALIFCYPENAVLIYAVLALLPLLAYVLLFRRDLVFPALVFLVPLSVSADLPGGAKADFPAEPLLGLIMLFLMAFIFLNQPVNKKLLLHPVTLLLFFELAWMFFASFYSEIPEVSFKRCIMRCIFLIVFFILFFHTIRDSFSAGKIFILYAAGCIVPVIHGIFFHAHFDFSQITAYLMPRPFFTEHTIYGACLAFVIPMLVIFVFNAKEFGLRGWALFFLSCLTLLIITGEFFSYSRAAWVSLGAALAMRFLLSFRIKMWMLMLVLVTGGFIAWENQTEIIENIRSNETVSNKGGISEHLLSVTNLQSDASNLERINRWKCAIRMANEKPFTGFGPGTYQFIYGRFQSRADMSRISTFRGTNGHAHSEFFNAISETGIPGGLIYLLIMLAVISLGLRVIYRAKDKKEKLVGTGALLGLVTFYVHGFFNAFLDSDKMAVLVFGSIAILAWLDIQQRKTKNKFSNEQAV